ncbi:DUF6934 family protein [Hymenobacter ruricola]|uniref:DUF6934 family protein n=1 Tax=Hymenobacter ruricola TaxID=2791023 RepID=UPI001E40AB01|nr:hypothetical protein [Hymenobacter ruricola]
MLDNRYIFDISPDVLTFEFDSVGPNGTVAKVVRYTEVNIKNFYNLGFGDKDPQSGYISDLSITNNNDSQKVLATVARTLYVFTEQYPEAIVFAAGSTLARTRLYRMGITTNLAAIEQDFKILGLTTDQEWEPFRKNVTYHAFSVQRKAKTNQP